MMLDGVLRCPVEDDCDQKSKKKPDPGYQETHVVTCGAEDGVDRIAFGSGEVVSFEMAVFFQMPDDWLDHCRQVNACIHREGRCAFAFRGG